MRTPSTVAALLASTLLTGCFLFWPEEDRFKSAGRSTGPRPEPDVEEAARGMILQTYFVIASRSGDRAAMRRCTYVDLLPDRCEITFVEKGRVVERVPTYQRGRDRPEWGDQGEDAGDAVEDAIEERFGDDRIALTRLGIFGVEVPPEGVLSARLIDGRVELHAGSPPRVLTATKAPPGVIAVQERYVSARAPELYIVSLTAESPTNRDRQSGFVIFRRFSANDYRAVMVVPPIDPRPIVEEPAPPAAPTTAPPSATSAPPKVLVVPE